MRKFLVWIILLSFLLGITGVAMAEKVELTFWSWRTEDIAAYENFIAEFNKEYPDINIKFVPYKNTEYNTILSTALQGGSGPDIIQLRAYGGLEPLANAGYLVPLEDKVPELEKFSENVLAGARSRRDGKVYGVPFATQNIQVLYNKALFDELDLKEPDTWAKLLGIAQKAKDAGFIPFANGTKDAWTLETLFGGIAPTFYGGTEFYNQVIAGEKTFTAPEIKRALGKMLELKPYLPDNYLGVGYIDMQMMFAQEMAVMFVAGSYEVGTMGQMNPDLKIGAFIVPGETEDAPAYNSIYVDGSYGINANSDHIDAALKFIRFTTTKEFGQMFTNVLKQISTVPGVSSEDETLAEIMEIAKPTPYLMLTGFRYGSPSGSALLQNELQGLFAGEQDIEKTLNKIQEGLETWYEPFQS